MPRIMVLNDGETYTALQGCKIYNVPPEVLEDEEAVDEFIASEDNEPVFVFDPVNSRPAVHHLQGVNMTIAFAKMARTRDRVAKAEA